MVGKDDAGRPKPTTAAPLNTSSLRTQNNPDPPNFQGTLRLQTRPFANIPRGDFQGIVWHLAENSLLWDEDSEPLLQEAIQALDYFNTHGVTQQGDKYKYAESCIQQYVILRTLQQRLKDRGRRSAPAVLQDFLKALQNPKSELRGLVYKGFDFALAVAKSRSQPSGRRDQTNAVGDSMQPKPRWEFLEEGGSSIRRNPAQNTVNPLLARMDLRDEPTQRRSEFTSDLATSRTLQDQGRGESLRAFEPNEFRGARQDNSSMDVRPNIGGLTTSHIPQRATSAMQLVSSSQKSDQITISTSGPASSLDPSYRVRPSNYYFEGRVFAMLWSEPYSEIDNDAGSARVTVGNHGERFYTSIRRMVVVNEDVGCCTCIPINSYGNRGLGKFADSPKHVSGHSIIFMDDSQAVALKEEPRSSKRPIAVRKASPDQKLSSASRLCYYQPQTIQHNVKTLDVGFVTKESLPYLLGYYDAVNKHILRAAHPEALTPIASSQPVGKRPFPQLSTSAPSVIALESRKTQSKQVDTPHQGSSIFASQDLVLHSDTLSYEPWDVTERKSAEDWLKTLQQLVHQSIRLQAPKHTKGKPVKITILDTGVDLPAPLLDAGLDANLKEHRSWLGSAPAEGVVLEEGSDADGHGTHAFGVLSKVADTAEVYVAQVFSNRPELRSLDTNTDTAERIAQAIDYATEHWKVDIITMSFGFPDWVSSIEKALWRARERRVLSFASASNAGGNAGLTYPARSSLVTEIYATDGLGNGYKRNLTPRKNHRNFATLGVAVTSWWPEHLKQGPTQSLSGTSTAAPVAAGIAALVLEIVNSYADSIEVLTVDDQVHLKEQIRTADGMEKVFAEMADSRETYDYVKPWALVNSSRAELDCRTAIMRILKVLKD